MSTHYVIQLVDKNYCIHDLDIGQFNSSEAAVNHLRKGNANVPDWAQTILVTERIDREIFRFAAKPSTDAPQGGEP